MIKKPTTPTTGRVLKSIEYRIFLTCPQDIEFPYKRKRKICKVLYLNFVDLKEDVL